MVEMVSQSRFHMWRAVFALVHTDHQITQEEKSFANNYLQNVPFSEEQKNVLREDLENPQDPAEVFSQISEPADQADFFQFARLVLWCDGDYAAQEESIFESVKSAQMFRMNPDKLREEIRSTREVNKLNRLNEDDEFSNAAQKRLGLIAFLRGAARL